MTVYLDANCVIYLVEANPTWGPKITARLAALTAAGADLATSDLTRTECLAGPLGTGDVALAANYQTFFSGPPVKLLPLTASVCERAAHIRAASNFRLKVPDCLHLAAAVEHGCDLFLTNDSQLAICTDITVEILTCGLSSPRRLAFTARMRGGVSDHLPLVGRLVLPEVAP